LIGPGAYIQRGDEPQEVANWCRNLEIKLNTL